MKDGTKKTMIWESNSQPPKNYIWIKPDGKAYEYINGAWAISPTIIMVKEDFNYVELIEKEITENGEFEAPEGKAFSKVTVNIPEPTPSIDD